MPLRSITILEPGEKKGGWVGKFVPAKPPAPEPGAPEPGGPNPTAPVDPAPDQATGR
jgi:hypothetical protein